eukprot:13718-Heterococcus_DN1.PRE.2
MSVQTNKCMAYFGSKLISFNVITLQSVQLNEAVPYVCSRMVQQAVMVVPALTLVLHKAADIYSIEH